MTASSPPGAAGLLRGNLHRVSGFNPAQEQLTLLVQAQGVRIERIVSHGHRSPEGFWYDQDDHEYVLLVAGAAELELDPGGPLRLQPGDWLHIPARLRHRVLWTDPDVDTIWLAVFVPAA